MVTDRQRFYVCHFREWSCEYCKYVLGEAYCYPNVKDNAGVTPLHSACE